MDPVQYAQQLQNYLAGALLPDPVKQKQAEAFLGKMSTAPYTNLFIPTLLRIVCNANVEESVRQIASIKFKNSITKGWEYHDDYMEVPEELKPTLRAQMIDVMCSVPHKLQAQISEAVRVMALKDFPDQWPDLLSSLVKKMATSTNPAIIIGALKTSHEILKQFRQMTDSNANKFKLQTALTQFAEPVTQFFKKVEKMALSQMKNKESLKSLYEALTLMCEIFYSFNSFTIPQYFEENLAPWMAPFRNFISTKENLGDVFAEPNNREVITERERLRTSIISCVSIYAERYEEEFKPYFSTFLNEIVKLLMSTQLHSRYDEMVINGLNFLGKAVMKKANKQIFQSPSTLRSMIQSVVYPNLMMHQYDVNEFEDNPEEFIRRDIEGSDKFTRRKASRDLLRNMRHHFDVEVTDLVLQVIQNLLAKYKANPSIQANWIGKETALQLYLATSVTGFTVARGVSNQSFNKTLQAKAEMTSFFRAHVFPELGRPDAHHVLKAAALKFMSVFRQQLASPKLIEVLVPLLSSKSVVVHSYAANCLERVLVIRRNNTRLISAESLSNFAIPIFKNLFAVVGNAEFSDNHYIMKAVMRVITTCNVKLGAHESFVGNLLNWLCATLQKLLKRSTSPQFNHFVFDSLAALIHASCSVNKAMVNKFIGKLMPVFQPILANGDSDFYPYVLQMLAELLSFATPGAPLMQLFQQLLDSLMKKEMWANAGLIPATVQLLQVYFRVASAHLVSGQYHVKILSIFQKLIRKRKTEQYGLELLQTLLSCLPLDALKPYLSQIMKIIGNRLNDKKRQGRV